MAPLIPQSILALRTYDRRTFLSDAIAGVTVGLVALPLAMAFAISSGMPPEAGIYCAVVAGFLTSALGGSLTAIGGPTGAFVVVVASIIADHGVDGLFVCTMMAGLMLVALGMTGVGSAIKYIPRPVIVGFTNGIAILIASTQIRDLFGLQLGQAPDDFVGRMRVVAAGFHTLSLPATLLGVTTVLLVLLTPRVIRRLPGTIVAIGLQALEDLADQVRASGRTLLLCGAREQPAYLMRRAEFHEHVGDANICANIQEALKRAADLAAAMGHDNRETS